MKFSAIILAAGQSERMGAFKPLLPIGNEHSVERCVNVARAAGVEDVIIVTGHQKIDDVINVKETGARTVHNEAFLSGMFSSVCTGVRELSGDTDGFFILPSDCCAVSPHELKLLLENFGNAAAIPAFGGKRGHPPLIPAHYISELLAYSGDDGLKGFLRQLPKIEVEMPRPGTLFDMDTPDDYVKLLKYLGLSPFPAKQLSMTSKSIKCI